MSNSWGAGGRPTPTPALPPVTSAPVTLPRSAHKAPVLCGDLGARAGWGRRPGLRRCPLSPGMWPRPRWHPGGTGQGALVTVRHRLPRQSSPSRGLIHEVSARLSGTGGTTGGRPSLGSPTSPVTSTASLPSPPAPALQVISLHQAAGVIPATAHQRVPGLTGGRHGHLAGSVSACHGSGRPGAGGTDSPPRGPRPLRTGEPHGGQTPTDAEATGTLSEAARPRGVTPRTFSVSQSQPWPLCRPRHRHTAAR